MTRSQEPPPKRPRKRKHTEYDKCIEIITKLGNDYDPSLFACFTYLNSPDMDDIESLNEWGKYK